MHKACTSLHFDVFTVAPFFLPPGIPERNLMTYDLSLLQAEVRLLIEIMLLWLQMVFRKLISAL